MTDRQRDVDRLVWLRAERRRLWPDRYDPDTGLELHRIVTELRQLENELGLNRHSTKDATTNQETTA
jgi:hypothetical protein